LTRAVQELRKQAGLELDQQVDLWLVAPEPVLAALAPYIGRLADDTLAAGLHHDSPPAGAPRTEQEVSGGTVEIYFVPRGVGRP
jgi:hypothetical protein